MALLLRVVSKPKWVAPDWMAPEDVPADALTDLRTDKNELSVWSVEADGTNLDAVLAAVAANRHRLDKLDYTLLDEARLIPIQIKCERSEGITPHVTANGAMHRDLKELTVQKIAQLAKEMMPLTRVRVPETEVRGLLLEALKNGALDRGRIQAKLLSELESTAR
jgi:hypothetical protein